MKNRSKLTLPKCPYCKTEYKDGMCEYVLSRLATEGGRTTEKVKCKNCGENFEISIHITYYGRKIK